MIIRESKGNGIASAPCRLRVWLVSQVMGWYEADGLCHVSLTGSPVIEASEVVPGTLTVTDQVGDDGLFSKSLACLLRPFGASMRARMAILRHQYAIATWTDERGCSRVSGSKSMPLLIDCEQRSGRWSLTLTGKGTFSDGYL